MNASGGWGERESVMGFGGLEGMSVCLGAQLHSGCPKSVGLRMTVCLSVLHCTGGRGGRGYNPVRAGRRYLASDERTSHPSSSIAAAAFVTAALSQPSSCRGRRRKEEERAAEGPRRRGPLSRRARRALGGRARERARRARGAMDRRRTSVGAGSSNWMGVGSEGLGQLGEGTVLGI